MLNITSSATCETPVKYVSGGGYMLAEKSCEKNNPALLS